MSVAAQHDFECIHAALIKAPRGRGGDSAGLLVLRRTLERELAVYLEFVAVSREPA